MMIAQMHTNIVPDTDFLEGEHSATSLKRDASRAKEEEFSDLLETYSGMAYNIALRMLHNPADAEDAVQEAFISAYRSLPKFNGQSKVTTWLYRIVVNVCLMKIRKEKTRSKYLSQTNVEDVVIHDWHNDPEKAAVNGELRDVLEQGLQRLTPDMRATVVLRDIQGMSAAMAAEVLSITISTLKSRLHRARLQLREYLTGYVTQPAP